ncbi:MAG TPA: tRNA pseudouridine(55) synthase TruB [Longimicrobiaceae bacterium]|nr:tRNA pseudouridine(55) synthase TruB [Longimicrobiaceae bacterium]
MNGLNGILPIDKPEGPTSHDVVSRARRALGLRRIGHSGTLDPFASGLLLLCLGPATRLAEYLAELPKTYRATMRLGAATDTDDPTGNVLARSDAWTSLSDAEVRAALARQVGEIQQLPPRYSAKKVQGQRLYAAARRGEDVERKPNPVTIYDLRVERVALPEVDFAVECGAGTYIRAIARDAGDALGVGAHLTRLRRTRVGSFPVESALALDRLDDRAAVAAALLSPAAAVAHLPGVTVDAAGAAALAHGRPVPAPPELAADQTVALLSASGELLAVGDTRGGSVHPRKVFA